MARAKRHFVPGYIWHITHRCHKRDFLLKLVRDRRRWISWLFEAKQRYGLVVLDYILTSNHIHLLVVDEGRRDVIPNSLRLIAGRVGQEYNNRKSRTGAFWEDRYHTTAVETGDHLIQCIAYIDLNMVRAGVVSHPRQWVHSGYHEIQHPKRRYRIIDIPRLMRLVQVETADDLRASHARWVDEKLERDGIGRKPEWTESIGVGSRSFLEEIRGKLGYRARGRAILEAGRPGAHQLREPESPYGSSSQGDKDNKHLWDL